MNRLQKTTALLAVSLIFLLSACSMGDRLDKLMVADGDGHRYLLKHNIGDTYFIEDLDPKVPPPFSEVNEKLRNKLGR